MAGEGQYKTRLVNSIHNYLQQSRFLNGSVSGKVETLPNPKWDDFEGAGIRRQQALVNNSVTHSLIRTGPNRDFNPAVGAYGALDVNYYNRVYSPLKLIAFMNIVQWLLTPLYKMVS